MMSLSVHDIGCRRGSRLLFKGLNFELQSGQALHLAGGNGAGKTSLMRLIAGLATPECGYLSWGGKDIRHLGEAYREQLFYVGHLNAVKEDLDAEEALQEWAYLAGQVLDASQAGRVLEEAGLAAFKGRALHSLSQGQRRRVALARLLLARQRRLWILDEPAVGLDEQAINWMLAMMESHLAGGGLLVYTTHQPLKIDGFMSQHLKLGDA